MLLTTIILSSLLNVAEPQIPNSKTDTPPTEQEESINYNILTTKIDSIEAALQDINNKNDEILSNIIELEEDQIVNLDEIHLQPKKWTELSWWNFLIAIIASGITIISIIGFIISWYIRVARRKTIIIDLLRHLYKSKHNILRAKDLLEQIKNQNSSQKKYLSKLIFTRLQSLDEDLLLSCYSNSMVSFKAIHHICCKLRNYNITAEYAGTLLFDKNACKEEKEDIINELLNRNKEIRKRIIELYLNDHYIQSLLNIYSKEQKLSLLYKGNKDLSMYRDEIIDDYCNEICDENNTSFKIYTEPHTRKK